MAKKLGCASCGGTKKMKVGGTTSSRAINSKGAGYAKAQVGGSEILKKGVYGMATTNTANAGIATMKKGGTHKMPNGKVMLNSKMKTGGAQTAFKKKLLKAQPGMSVGPTPNWTKPYPKFKHSDRITKGYETPFQGPLNESESISVSKGMMSPAMQNYMKSPNQSKNSEEVNQKKKGGVPKAQLGGSFEKRAERKITKSIKKSVKNSGKKI